MDGEREKDFTDATKKRDAVIAAAAEEAESALEAAWKGLITENDDLEQAFLSWRRAVLEVHVLSGMARNAAARVQERASDLAELMEAIGGVIPDTTTDENKG